MEIDIALERRLGLGIGGLRARQIDRLPAVMFDVRARRIEVRVVGNDAIRANGLGEQDAFRRAALVDGMMCSMPVISATAETKRLNETLPA